MKETMYYWERKVEQSKALHKSSMKILSTIKTRPLGLSSRSPTMCSRVEACEMWTMKSANNETTSRNSEDSNPMQMVCNPHIMSNKIDI